MKKIAAAEPETIDAESALALLADVIDKRNWHPKVEITGHSVATSAPDLKGGRS